MRRVAGAQAAREQAGAGNVLTADLYGAAAQYASTLLFIGYEVNGLVEIVVYPRYRFSSDDRVQGQIGNLRFQPGTPWSIIMAAVDELHEEGQRYYRRAVSLRAAELRSQGAKYESAYDAITDLFRESWHGFALRLKRDGVVTRDNVRFEGCPPEPVLVAYRSGIYTLYVSPTGSILLLTGDRRKELDAA